MPVVEEKVLDQEKEIGDLLEGFVPPTPAPESGVKEEENPEDKPVVEEKKDESKGEERTEKEAGGQEPVGAAAKKEDEKPEVKPQEKPQEEKEETELERLKRENEEFRLQLSDMAAKATGQQPVPQKPQEQAKPQYQPVPPVPSQPVKLPTIKFVKSEEEFDEVMKDHDSFNALLTQVFQTGAQYALRTIPQVATAVVDSQMTMRQASNEFFDMNRDLLPHRKYVGYISNEIVAQHPDWDLPKVLEETEKEVRGRLKIARPQQSQMSTPQQNPQPRSRTVVENPGFVPSGGGGGRRGQTMSDNLSGQEKEIADLIT